MYKEIEELQKKLAPNPNRGPASADPSGQLNKLFNLPTSAKWDDPSLETVLPASGTKDQMIGGAAPDYSGFDDLEKKLNGLKPRDTSKTDLISMGLATGIGAMFGQAGVGASIAGNYGMDRFNKAEKREDSMEDMILKLQAARAASMAKGSKGTKLRGSSGDDPTKGRYLGPDGYLHTPERQRTDGTWAKLETDPVYDKPTPRIVTVDSPDGGRTNLILDKNAGTSIGSRNAKASYHTDAKGNKIPVNDYTVLQNGGLPEDFNKTNMDLSPVAKKDHTAIRDQANRDSGLRQVEAWDNATRSALESIRIGTPLSDTKVIKNISTVLEGGRSTDRDFEAVSNVDRGVYSKLEALLVKAETGGLTDTGRKEAEELLVSVLNNNKRFYDRKISRYNMELKRVLGKEMRPDLALPSLTTFTGKEQSKNNFKNIESTRDFSYTKDIVEPLSENGVPVMDNGRQVLWKYVLEKDKNGNLIKIPKERVYE